MRWWVWIIMWYSVTVYGGSQLCVSIIHNSLYEIRIMPFTNDFFVVFRSNWRRCYQIVPISGLLLFVLLMIFVPLIQFAERIHFLFKIRKLIQIHERNLFYTLKAYKSVEILSASHSIPKMGVHLFAKLT